MIDAAAAANRGVRCKTSAELDRTEDPSPPAVVASSCPTGVAVAGTAVDPTWRRQQP